MKGDGRQARVHQQSWTRGTQRAEAVSVYVLSAGSFFLTLFPYSLFYVSSASEDIFLKFLRAVFGCDVCCLNHSRAQELKVGLGKQPALISRTSFFAFLEAIQRRCTIRKHSQGSLRYVSRTSACVCSPHLAQPDLVQMPPHHLISSPYLDSG